MKLYTLISIVLVCVPGHVAGQSSSNPMWGLGAFGGQVGVIPASAASTESTTSFALSTATTPTSSVSMGLMDIPSTSSTSTTTSSSLTTSTSTITSTVIVTLTRPLGVAATSTPVPARVKREMMFVEKDEDDRLQNSVHRYDRPNSVYRKPALNPHDEQPTVKNQLDAFSIIVSFITSFSSKYTKAYTGVRTAHFEGQQHCVRYLISTYQPLGAKTCLGNDVVKCNKETGTWDIMNECEDVGKRCKITSPRIWGLDVGAVPIRSAGCVAV